MDTSITSSFRDSGYVYIPGFLDETTVKTVSRYFEYSINSNNNGWIAATKSNDSNDVSKYCKYGDPLIDVILENSINDFEAVVGEELLPTYSYSRVYMSGDELKEHRDRPACEYSATINIATKGSEPWPIYMRSEGRETSCYILNPGDAVIYKGSEVSHWRNKMHNTNINVQIMLHYVAKYGEHKETKWDGRPSLGLPADTSIFRR